MSKDQPGSDAVDLVNSITNKETASKVTDLKNCFEQGKITR